MSTIADTDSSRQPAGGWANSRHSDVEIIHLVLSGEESAYEAIMRRYNRLLFRLARSIVSNDEDAKDVVQTGYVRAYFRLSQFDGPDGFPSWISRIVINESLSRLRKRRLPIESDVSTEELPLAAQYQPEEVAMGQDTMDMIESAIDALPSDFRVVFMLRGVEGLSINETAEILDINPATVKTRYHRGKKLLQKVLSRRIDDAVPTSFSFDGQLCDNIVHNVFAAIAGVSTNDTNT